MGMSQIYRKAYKVGPITKYPVNKYAERKNLHRKIRMRILFKFFVSTVTYIK